VVLYEDELADNGVSLLTVKVVSFFSILTLFLPVHGSNFFILKSCLCSHVAESDAKLLVPFIAVLGKLDSTFVGLIFLFSLNIFFILHLTDFVYIA
jgi:hypothetical protein